jgi:lysophospholipase L1-like esterase
MLRTPPQGTVSRNEFAQVAARANYIIPEHVRHIRALIESDMGLKCAILGDSTEAGSADRGGDYNAYGELADKIYPTGQERFILNLMYSSPYFLPVTQDFYPPYKGSPKSSYLRKFPWYTLQLVKSDNPSFALSFPHKGVKRNTLTIVYFMRYGNGAVKFDVVCNGVTTTIDTYKAPQSFGSVEGQIQTGWDIAYKEIEIPTSGDTFSLLINNVITVDRGEGVAADGIGAILGFYYGKQVGFKNLAVSGATLLNNSSNNVAKGITTDDRFQAAYDYGANVFMIGWGTNDSVAGKSTVEAFTADLKTRIDEIRAEVPDAVIILFSDPQGLNTYANNQTFFAAMKQVAIEKSCSFFDVNALFSTFRREVVIADDVHPSQTGYAVIGYALSEIFKTDAYQKAISAADFEKRILTLESNFKSFAVTNILNLLSNKVRASFFDSKIGTVVNDLSGNGKNIALSADALTLSPKRVGVLDTLTFGASNTWEYADAADLSFGDGAGNDSPFSVIWFGKPVYTASTSLITKRREYQLFISGLSTGPAFLLYNNDGTAYIGRRIGSFAVPSTSDYVTFIGTYSGSKLSSGIKLYQNGIRVDDTDYQTGSYPGMTPGDNVIGNYRLNGEVKEAIGTGEFGFVAIVSGELTAAQVKQIDTAIRKAYGLI